MKIPLIMSVMLLIVNATASGSAGAAPAATDLTATTTPLNHGRFKDVLVYVPKLPAISFVLFISPAEGWNAAAEAMALALAQQGAMVAGIDLPRFTATLEADGAQCVSPDGDLENLSHFIQAYFHNPTYLAPLLAGISSGATLAYAVLAQAPKNTFAGALTLNFCPHLNLDKPLCKGSGLEFTRSGHGSGVDFLPIKTLSNPWVTIQSLGSACPATTVGEFVAKVHGAAMAIQPDSGLQPFSAAFAKLATADLQMR